ncbi:MAG: hypothetical protein ABIK79_05930 [Chloroflexota bacterium]
MSKGVWFALKEPQEEASDPKGFSNPLGLWGKERGLCLEETPADRRFYIATLRLCILFTGPSSDTNPLPDVHAVSYVHAVPDGYALLDTHFVSNVHIGAHADANPNGCPDTHADLYARAYLNTPAHRNAGRYADTSAHCNVRTPAYDCLSSEPGPSGGAPIGAGQLLSLVRSGHLGHGLHVRI